MKHSTLRILFGLLFMVVPCALSAASEAPIEPTIAATECATDDASTISLTVEGNQVHVQGAAGATLEVFDITGKRISAIRIDSPDRTLTLNLRRGCYIFRIGKLVRKVAWS